VLIKNDLKGTTYLSIFVTLLKINKISTMKKTLLFFLACTLILFYTGRSFGQCTPDPSVTDPEGNGEMVPDTLEAIETVALNQTVTIIAPDAATFLGSPISILYIAVKNLQNKPSWLTYACTPSNCQFTGSVSRCVQTTGTPPAGSAGFYNVTVLVDVFVTSLSGPFCFSCSFYPNGYDSGMPLVVWVHPASWGVTEQIYKGFGIINPKPNPFSNTVTLGCYTENPQNVSLKVLDMVGQEVYSENLSTVTGENYFRFNGSDLANGIYFYSITDARNHIITKKMIKS
jgi:hypothetical protein